MTPMQIGKIKFITSQLTTSKCKKLAEKALKCETQQQVIDLVESFYKKEKIKLEC
jgi:phosphoenolpyruvate-protein kinase (PTS system EI component)